MNKKFFSVLFVVVLTASYVQAQFTFGARAGLNLMNVSVKYDREKYETFNPKYKLGFQVGIAGEYGDNFAIQPGILFAMQGYKLELKEFIMGDMLGWEEMVSVNVNYLQIPVNVQYKFDLGGSALLLQAGPYFGFAISGKKKTELFLNGNIASETKTDLIFGSEVGQLNRFDLGLSLGVALQLDNIQVGLGYKIGLSDMDNNDKSSTYDLGGTSMYNRGLSITATYFWGK